MAVGAPPTVRNVQPSPPIDTPDRIGPDGASLGAIATIVVLAIAATLAIYEPWRALPFEIIDFSEFLPFLHQPTIVARWHAFTQYYASQGRWNIAAYLALILKWSAFGTHTTAWQLTRFAEMWLIMAGVYLTLRRLMDADRWGAAAGAGLFAIATCSAPAWVRLTMGEPLGFVFLLGAVLMAMRYRAAANWRRDAIAIGGLIAVALLAKEMLVVFVPFIVVVASCATSPGQLSWPRTDARTRWLVVVTTVAVLAVLIPTAIIWRAAPAGSYASQFVSRRPNSALITVNFATVLLPVTRSRLSVLSLFTTPANALFLAVVCVGGAYAWTRGRAIGMTRTALGAWGVLALSLPAAVVLAYVPWSLFNDFYGLPYVLGSAMLLAGAVTAADRLAPPIVAVALRLACVGMLAVAGVRATLPARESMARREVNAAVVDYLGTHPGGPVEVMTAGFAGGHWPGTATALSSYAAAQYPAAGLRPFGFALCSLPPHTFAVDGQPGTVVSYADDCGPNDRATATFRAAYSYPTLHPFAMHQDTLRIDVCDPDCTR